MANYFDKYDIAEPAPAAGNYFDKYDPGAPTAEPRSLFKEVPIQAYAGATIDLPKQFGQALQWMSSPGEKTHEWGKEIQDWATTREANEQGLAPQVEGRGIAGRALSTGARALAPSTAVMVPAAIGAAAAPVVGATALAGAAAGGAAGAFGLFGASQAQDTYDKLRKAGVDEAAAREAGWINLMIEGGGETAGTIAGLKLFGLAGKALTKGMSPVAGAIAGATDTAVVKPFLAQLPKTLATEMGTEFGQNFGEAWVENKYGAPSEPGQGPLQQGIQGAEAALGMTILLAPFGLSGFAARAKQNERRALALEDPTTPVLERLAAATVVFNEINAVDKDAAKAWSQNSTLAIVTDSPIILDETTAQPGEFAGKTPYEIQGELARRRAPSIEQAAAEEEAITTAGAQAIDAAQDIDQIARAAVDATSQPVGPDVAGLIGSRDFTAEQERELIMGGRNAQAEEQIAAADQEAADLAGMPARAPWTAAPDTEVGKTAIQLAFEAADAKRTAEISGLINSPIEGGQNAEAIRSDQGQIGQGGQGGQPGVQPGAVEGSGDLQQPARQPANLGAAPGGGAAAQAQGQGVDHQQGIVIPETPQQAQALTNDHLAAARNLTRSDAARAVIDAEISRRQQAPSGGQQAIAPALAPQGQPAGAAVVEPPKLPERPKGPVLQNRDRSSAASVTQMAAIAANPDPARLSFSRDFLSGAPTIIPDGAAIPPANMGAKERIVTAAGREIPVQYAVVEAKTLLPSHGVDGIPNQGYDTGLAGRLRVVAGNGRAAGLQGAYRKGTTLRYIDGILADANLHGVPRETIEGMKQPVLVRVMADADVTQNLGDETNIAAGAELSPAEKAGNDARRIDLTGLEFGEDGEVTAEAVRQFVTGMPETERAGLIDQNGQPTRQAYDRLTNAVFIDAYVDPGLVALQSQATDTEARTVMAAMVRAAPAMARLKEAGDLDIRPIVVEAAKAVVNAKRAGVSVTKFAAQADITMPQESRVVLQFFAANIRSAARIGEGLARAAATAAEQAGLPAVDMFGNVPRMNRTQVLEKLYDTEGQKDLGDQTGAGAAGQYAGGQAADRQGQTGGGATPGIGQAGAEQTRRVYNPNQQGFDLAPAAAPAATAAASKPTTDWKGQPWRGESFAGGEEVDSQIRAGDIGTGPKNNPYQDRGGAVGRIVRERLQDTHKIVQVGANAFVVRPIENKGGYLAPTEQTSARPGIALTPISPAQQRAEAEAADKAKAEAEAEAKRQEEADRQKRIDAEVKARNEIGAANFELTAPAAGDKKAQKAASDKAALDQLAGQGGLFQQSPVYQAVTALQGAVNDLAKAIAPGAENATAEPLSVEQRKGRDQGQAPAQRDLFAETEVSRQENPQPAILVEPAQRGILRVGFDKIDTQEKAAHAFAALRKAPREYFQMLLADKNDKPLAVFDLFAGTITQTSVYTREVLTAAYSTPGAAKIWFAHNHPSGVAEPSSADVALTKSLAQGLGPDLGIEFQSHIIIAGNKAVAFGEDGRMRKLDIPPASRKYEIPIMERVIKRQSFAAREGLSSPAQARAYIEKNKITEPGLILMDAQHRVLVFWPMARRDMANLRTKDSGTGFGGLARLISKINPAAAMIFDPATNGADLSKAAGNMRTALGLMDVKLLDAFMRDAPLEAKPGALGEAGPLVSLEERGMIVAPPTFFSQKEGAAQYSVKPWYYSALARGIETATMKAAPVAGWKSYIQGLVNKGAVKQAEIEATGINDWLATQEGKVTKEKIKLFFDGLRLTSSNTPSALLLGQDTAAAKGVSDAGSVGAKILSDATNSDAFREHGFSGLDVPTQRSVLEAMFAAAQNLHVLNAVVASIPVGVVDILRSQQLTPEMFFHDHAMLADALFRNRIVDVDISPGSVSDLVESFALSAAENTATSRDHGLTPVDRGTALGTMEGRHGVTPQSSVVTGAGGAQTLSAPNTVRPVGGNINTRPTGMAPALIKTQLARAIEKLTIPTVVHADVEAARQATGVAIPDTARAMYHADQVHLFASSLDTALEAESAFWHEVEHAGLAHLYGTGSLEYERALTKIASLNRNIRQNAAMWRGKYGQEAVQRAKDYGMTEAEAKRYVVLQSYDEALADLSGANAKISGLKPFLTAVQRFLRAIGLTNLADAMESATDAEALALITKARNAVMEGGAHIDVGQLSPAFTGTQTDQTQTKAFRAWFGDSQAVDENGQPKVYYHGTARDITEFKPKQAGAIFLSPDPMTGDDFAQRSESWKAKHQVADGVGQNVMPVYVKVENPFDPDSAKNMRELRAALGETWEGPDFGNSVGDVAAGRWTALENPVVQKYIKAHHDGFYVYEGGVKNLAVFSPAQIKSAIGNRGTFDPNNPDVRFSRPADRVFSGIMSSQKTGALLKAAMNSPAALGLFNAFNSQYHKAEMLARKGIPGFKAVFNEMQAFLNDINAIAVKSEQQAPAIFRELTGMNPKSAWAYFKGAAKESDIAAIGPWLNHGTLYGKGNPLEGRVWTDDQLRGKFEGIGTKNPGLKPLTDQQIELYHQARAAIDQSLEDNAKALMFRHVNRYGIVFDKDMSLADVAELVREQLDAQIEDQKERAGALQDLIDDPETEFGDKDQRDAHKRLKADIEKAEKLAADLEQVKETITGIEDKADALIEHGYMPLMRFGNRTVTARDSDGKVQFFYTTDGKPLVPGSANLEMNEVAAAVRALHPDWQVTTGIKAERAWQMYQGMSMEALENFLDFLDPETKAALERDATIQEFITSAVNNRSVLKRMIHREGTPGFAKDVPRILSAFITSSARNSSGLYHLGEAKRLVEEIPDRHGDVKDEASDLVKYVTEPGEEAAKLRGFLFFHFLGGSLAAAAVNMTQTVMMTAPWLSQYTSASGLAKSLISAAKLAVQDPVNIEGEKGRMLQKAERTGVTAPQQIFHLTATAANNPFSSNRGFRSFMTIWGGLFSTVEVFNRRVAFMAAYDAGKSNGLSGNDLYDFATRAVVETQLIYNKGNKPNLGRGAVGSTIMTFKAFSIGYLELVRRLPPQQQLLMLGILALAAGGEGLPFAEDIEDLVDTLGQWLGFSTNTGKWTGKVIADTFGKEYSRPILKGLGGMLPIDLHSRLGMQNLLPGTAFFKPSEIDKTRDVAEAVGPFGSVLKSVSDSLQLLARGKWDKAAVGAAPKAVRDAYNGVHMIATGESQDTKGRLAMKDVTAVEAFGKAIGFNPQRAAVESEAKREIMLDRNLRTVRMDEITSDIADAMLRSDAQARQDAIERLRQWNVDNPEMRIDQRQVMRSVQERIRAAKRTSAERFIKSTPKPMKQEAREALK